MDPIGEYPNNASFNLQHIFDFVELYKMRHVQSQDSLGTCLRTRRSSWRCSRHGDGRLRGGDRIGRRQGNGCGDVSAHSAWALAADCRTEILAARASARFTAERTDPATSLRVFTTVALPRTSQRLITEEPQPCSSP